MGEDARAMVVNYKSQVHQQHPRPVLLLLLLLLRHLQPTEENKLTDAVHD